MLSTKKAYNAHTSNSNKMEKFVHLHVHTQYSILDGQVIANLLIYKSKIVGGDICSVGEKSFIHGFEQNKE